MRKSNTGSSTEKLSNLSFGRLELFLLRVGEAIVVVAGVESVVVTGRLHLSVGYTRHPLAVVCAKKVFNLKLRPKLRTSFRKVLGVTLARCLSRVVVVLIRNFKDRL